MRTKPAPLLIALLLYWNTRSVAKSLMVLLAVPFSAIGAVWSVYLLGYNLSIAVWIGFIALMGVDVETGIFMLLYLDWASKRAWREGRLETRAQLHEAIMQGAAQRIRPKVMTVSAIVAGLIPIFWSTGVGSDVLKRIAAPMIGGILTSFLIELVVYPAIYEIWRGRRMTPTSLPEPALSLEK
jgi:Cu(I)/Ag(I) efflux system membrane protein CusA/SilA